MSDPNTQEMKQEIAGNLAKKDYYDILGLPKTATDPEVKKAYRNLALRFHPDKNSVQGSKEVFKKVSHAYSTLIDPEKKAHYDRYGPEEEQQRPTNRRRNPQQDFDDYDDIFRAFFGGGMHAQHARRGGRTYTYSFGGNQGQGQQQQQQQRGGLNLSLVFILLFVVYTIAPLFRSGPSFSAVPSNQHKFKLKTSILQVDYYASQSYFQESKDPQFKKHSEMTIDRQYLLELEKKCEGKKRQRKRLEEMAYRESPGPRRQSYLSQVKRVDVSTCRTISDLNQRHEDYVRDLTYMK